MVQGPLFARPLFLFRGYAGHEIALPFHVILPSDVSGITFTTSRAKRYLRHVPLNKYTDRYILYPFIPIFVPVTKASRPANIKRKRSRAEGVKTPQAAGKTAASAVEAPVPQTKADKTREYIQKQAAPLFNKQGFAGTSLGDLTHATGLTKGALYGNFRDKDGIALAAFEYSMKKIRAAMSARLESVTTNKQKLFILLEFFGEYVMQPPIPGGCPLMNYGVESDDSQKFLRKPVAREMQATINFIESCLEGGVRSGELKPELDVTPVARLIFCAVEGAIVVSRVTGNRAHMDAVVNHCKSVLDQFSVT